jgi:hypothetical protein
MFFRRDISSLVKRAKSIEVAGAKSEFVDYAAAFGYLHDKVEEIASEPDKASREKLKINVQNTANALGGLHPLALAFIVEIGRGVVQDDSWPQHAKYILDLRERGFIELSPNASAPQDITKETRAKLTASGDKFLERLGYVERVTRNPFGG